MPPPKSSPPVPARGRSSPWPLVLAAWAVPGLGHLLQGRARKALVFFVVLVFMDVLGLTFGGRLFPFEIHAGGPLLVTLDPLVCLAALAEWTLGAPRLIAALGGFGHGVVTSATYEYGNTFLIVAGLLNALITLDAFDAATGRKAA
jgi:hypothetical protein